MKFLKSHEWINIEGKTAKIGISDYAEKQLGDIVYISLPEVGGKVTCGQEFGDVESVKAVSSVFSPCCGVVIATNTDLDGTPEMVNESPYDAWFIEVEINGLSDQLMTEEQYKEYLLTL